MKHISPTFMYIIPMYLRLTTFTKTLLQCHFTYIFCYFISLWGSIHDSADCWSAHISPACPRQLQTCARLMQDWVASAGWPPPNKNPGYAGDTDANLLLFRLLLSLFQIHNVMSFSHLCLDFTLLLFLATVPCVTVVSKQSCLVMWPKYFRL